MMLNRNTGLYRALGVLPLAACLLAAPAHAQSVDNPTGMNNPTSLQPKTREPENAPQALPGMGAAAPQTAPNLAAPSSGDPTTALFNAINSNDYNAAQDAVSRGADINQENAFGETPLDLAVALSRNSITFMLLSARNEGGGGPPVAGSAGGGAAPVPNVTQAAAAPAARAARRQRRLHPIPAYQPGRAASSTAASAPRAPGNDPGTPNADAGFLGFGPKE